MKNKIVLLLFLFLPLNAHAQHEHREHGEHMQMQAFLGEYPHSREASGTSWQPESSLIQGLHVMRGDWDLMFHGSVFGVYDYEGGKRGKEKGFSASMLMAMANRRSGSATVGWRSMLSLDPLMGKRGYPLLFQTGETYDGIHPLIDRQHPHDFFMEEAFTYSVSLPKETSLFIYLGLPGEPALGPPAFMHRFSALDNPQAPLGHHWLDSTHITYGVITAGYILDRFKLDGSLFNGREPDERRWDIESPRLDSYSARFSYNPTDDLSLQFSYGWLDSPEQLEPDVDMRRITASAMFNRNFNHARFQATCAWGRNDKRPGLDTNAVLLEAAFNVKMTHTVFSRFEYTQKDELFQHDEQLAGKAYSIKKYTVGYVYDFPEYRRMQWGIGGSYSVHDIPETLQDEYSRSPCSYTLFARLKF